MSQPDNQDAPAPPTGAGASIVSAVAKGLSYLACLFLFAMMAVTFVDVLGRYLFLSPLPAGYEIVSLIMPAIIFLALPLTILRNTHVTVDLLDSFVPAWLAKYQAIVANLFGACALGLVSWRLFIRARDQHTYEEVTDELILDLWPFSVTMATLCAIAVLAFVANIIALLKDRRTGAGSHD